MSFSGAHAIAHGDVLAVLKDLPDNEFDALLCDPPYGFSFMGKAWDYQVPSVEVWKEALRVLKPGAPLIAFGGTRTFHRVAVNIEDAGFELRDVLAYLYGVGFPKSLDVSKAIDKAAGATREVVGPNPNARPTDGQTFNAMGAKTHPPITAPATPLAEQWSGYGTSLKPAWEPAILARKPLEGTVAANVAKWGCGGLAIDACRIEGPPRNPGFVNPSTREGDWGMQRTGMVGSETPQGRWPANVAMDEDAAAALDAQTGVLTSHGHRTPIKRGMGYGGTRTPSTLAPIASSSGGASRFFYCATVSTREREHGCASLPQRTAGEMTGDRE